MKLITLVLGMVVIAEAGVASAQAPVQKTMFEVASVEPIKANSVRSGGSCHGKDSEVSSEQPHLMPFPPLLGDASSRRLLSTIWCALLMRLNSEREWMISSPMSPRG